MKGEVILPKIELKNFKRIMRKFHARKIKDEKAPKNKIKSEKNAEVGIMKLPKHNCAPKVKPRESGLGKFLKNMNSLSQPAHRHKSTSDPNKNLSVYGRKSLRYI